MASRAPKDDADSPAAWLSLGPAARLLGVSDVTLRHWADAGRIKTYRTIGSHRRFARDDLVAFLRDREHPVQAEDLEDQALQRLRRRFRGPRVIRPPLESLSEDERGKLRVLGRRVVELALRYHRDRRHRVSVLEEARFIGREYGLETERIGLSLPQSIESFLYHRTALIDTVRTLTPPESSRDETLDLSRDISELTDSVLLALVQAFEEAAAASLANTSIDRSTG